MKNLRLIIIFLFFFISSCTQTFQNNGLSEKKIDSFDIVIGKTSKKYLIENFGPPMFENVFNDNVIYYVSHRTSYKTFDKRKTRKLLVLEIKLDDKNIVQKIKKYSDKDGFDLQVSKNEDDTNINLISLWKDIIRALARKNTVD